MGILRDVRAGKERAYGWGIEIPGGHRPLRAGWQQRGRRMGFGGQKPSPQPQLLALAQSWGADYRLFLVGGENRLLLGGQRARLD